VIRLAAFLICLLPALGFSQLRKLENCVLVETGWSDGDSFQIKTPDGKTQTIRLYGVDCIEMHVQGDDSNARRLRDQRRYFGINDISVAKTQGEAAKAATAKWLDKPFTVHTTFADGRGDGRFSRVYGFVKTADGSNLSELLVSQGLARAFGVVRQLPDGTAGDEWMEQLKDLELTAARAGRGAWKHTDWEKLPAARKEARHEIAELDQVRGNAKARENQPVDINSAARDELMTLPSVGEKTANEIIGARPFAKVADLNRVPGIGPATLKKIEPFVVVGKAGEKKP
jgi:DNA uptake protein ComE-like DNA-binding protein